jgi:dinuclear metal center YbgI/SA1388 family protein
MPTPIADILAEIDSLLEPSRFQDYGPNGLQVPGASEISTLVTGVSAHVELFERARAEDADLILVHHGLFWGSGAGPIDATMKRRLRLLFDADIALAAYHLPLDAHPEIGNNALIAGALGATQLQPFAVHRGQPIGCLATLPGDGLPADGPDGFFAAVQRLTGQQPLVLASGPAVVRVVAIVSGAGTDHLPEAIAAGADAFLTGEPAERATALAAEGGVHFLAAGHHATETFGIRRLGEHLARRFPLKHLFIDVKNPI